MYPGYLYVLHASQPGKLKRVTFHTVESEPIMEIQNVMGKTSTVYRVQHSDFHNDSGLKTKKMSFSYKSLVLHIYLKEIKVLEFYHSHFFRKF